MMMQCIGHLNHNKWWLVRMRIKLLLLRTPKFEDHEDLKEFFSILLRKGTEYPKKSLDILTLLFSDKWKDLSTDVLAFLLRNDDGEIFSYAFLLIFENDSHHRELANFVMSNLAIEDIFGFFRRTYKAEYYSRSNRWYMNLIEYLRLQLEGTLLECIPHNTIEELEKCFRSGNSLQIRGATSLFFKKTMKNASHIKLILKIDFIQLVFFGYIVYQSSPVIVRMRMIAYGDLTPQNADLRENIRYLMCYVSPTTEGGYYERIIRKLLTPELCELYPFHVLDILMELFSSKWGYLTAYYVYKYAKKFSKGDRLVNKAEKKLLKLEDILEVKRDAFNFFEKLSLYKGKCNPLQGKEEA